MSRLSKRAISRVLFPGLVTLAGTAIIHLGRLLPATSSGSPGRLRRATSVSHPKMENRSLFSLAPSGVYHASLVTATPVRSYRTISPLPSFAEAMEGGIFSVALSLGLPLPGVTRHHALWSSDFPPAGISSRQRSPRPLRHDHTTRRSCFKATLLQQS